MARSTTVRARSRSSMVAAATALHGRPGTKLEVKPTEWQNEAWNLYDVIGASRFVANTVANAVSRCRLYIAKLDPDTGEIEGEADEPALRPYVASPFGVGDDRRENVRLAALNLFVGGEYYQVGEAARVDGERDRWYIVSAFDFEKKKGGGGGATLTCDRPPMVGGGKAELDPGTEDARGRDVVMRVWTPHPKHSREADSPFRAAIPDLNILHTIKKREAAELDSRLAGAGILFIPDTFDLPDRKGNPGGTVQDLMDELIEIASEVISDPSHPSSIIPYILKVRGEDIDKVKLMNFWSELSEAIGDLSDRKIRALAQAFDAPIETLEGAGNTNHWNLWRIAEETITTHYEPVLSRIAASITNIYLRPGLTKDGRLDPYGYAYAFDTTPLRVRADRFGDAVKLFELGLLSDEATRKSGDFTEEDAPSEKEKAARLARELILARPELATGELARLAGLGERAAPVVIESTSTPAPTPTAAAEPVESAEPRAVQGPPAAPEPDEAMVAAAALADPDAAVTAIANAAVHRALELAGGRLARSWPRGADRSRLHTTLAVSPNRGQASRALDGAWATVPVYAAGLGVDTDQLTNALHAYTIELLTRGRDHEPEALAAVLAFSRITEAAHAR